MLLTVLVPSEAVALGKRKHGDTHVSHDNVEQSLKGPYYARNRFDNVFEPYVFPVYQKLPRNVNSPSFTSLVYSSFQKVCAVVLQQLSAL